MQPFVVAGVDGSAESLAAAAWAAREAARRELPLRLVHARDAPGPRDGDLAAAAARQRAGGVLRRAEERVRAEGPGVRLLEEQTDGPAPAVLLARARDAELLVLGSRGLSGFTGFLVGSVALAVSARAERPVVLVRAGEDAADERLPAEGGGPATDTGHRDVVLGLDPGRPRDEVTRFAFEAARLRRARLRAVHTRRVPGDVPERLDLLRSSLRLWREKYPGVETVETVVEDRPANVLVRAATGAGLLVVGHRVPDHRRAARLGAVPHAAIHHVGCPVAVVPYR
ncbi:universal stress protein [Streptomyces sp. NPDC026672]|uniref:universal stress protein n=1 Tax=unclassified Streptomyces TaxID=2593676 RepID=UPI0033DD0176